MSAPTTEIALDSDALHGIAVEIWSAYLGLDLSSPLTPIPNPGPLEVVASISVTGAWDGHVVVSASERAGIAIAAAMLALDLDDVTDADLLDAAGELVNVVGGNVKTLLPQPSLLSLPLTSRSGQVRYPGTQKICALYATWRGEPVAITVLQVDLS
jgi:chemotaxis protein CheX